MIPDVPFTPLNNCEPIIGYELKSWAKTIVRVRDSCSVYTGNK
jgi:hypothetical protein